MLCGFLSLVGCQPVGGQFYMNTNDQTIRCPDARPGQKGKVDGVTYEAVGIANLT